MGKNRSTSNNNNNGNGNASKNSIIPPRITNFISNITNQGLLNLENIQRLVQRDTVKTIMDESNITRNDIIKQILTDNPNGLPVNEYDHERIFLTNTPSEFKIYKDGTNELQQIYSKEFVMRNIPKKQREFQGGQLDWSSVFNN